MAVKGLRRQLKALDQVILQGYLFLRLFKTTNYKPL